LFEMSYLSSLTIAFFKRSVDIRQEVDGRSVHM
jgi:hypothetical protein